MHNVIPVDFRPTSPVHSDEVVSRVRKAGAALASHTGQLVKLRHAGNVGSAFVYDPNRLGVTVGYYSVLRERPYEMDVREWQTMREHAARELVIEVTADEEWLLDGALATAGMFGNEYANPEFTELDKALEWVRTNCRIAALPRATAEDVLEWEKRKVVYTRPNGEVIELSVFDVVGRVFGPVYGGSVTVEKLMTRHGMSATDAVQVAMAVKKLVPRRKTDGTIK